MPLSSRILALRALIDGRWKMAQFEVGDVVRLRSGGPKMTVQEVIEIGGNIRCQWFVQGEVRTAVFHPRSLDRLAWDDERGEWVRARGAPAR
jgi:uncharacterized protein YodC (DUF2158 family)